MQTWTKRIGEYSTLAIAIVILSGCAVGKAFMAGYQPPQTIADLINEQYALAGEIPPEIDLDNRSSKRITLSDAHKTQSSERDANTSELNDYMLEAPVQRFVPRFTYKGIQDYAAQLAMQLVKNGNGLNGSAMIGISSFVKLDTTLQNTTVLGNQLAEYSISEIQQFGLNVIDFKLMPAIRVTRSGDLAYSRDVLELAGSNTLNHILSGTMIEKRDGTFVNARIIELKTGRVISTGSVLIPRFVVQQSAPKFVSYSAD